jgi:hypothetical protein
LHLGYCDFRGKYGPLEEKSQELAHMCAVAIDFGKHGKTYVPSEKLKWYNKVINVKGYPEFMEKEGKNSRKSTGVLGKLYSDINDVEDAVLKSFIRLDYEKSILLQYDLDKSQIDYAKQNL